MGQLQTKVVAFITEYTVVDRIIEHLKLTFVADRPPPPHGAFQEYLLAADPTKDPPRPGSGISGLIPPASRRGWAWRSGSDSLPS